MKTEFRCHCPITTAIDLLGDKWTLVIIKQLLTEDKYTFKDLLGCDESIATNILSSRLKKLEEFKIITKEKLPHNKKTNVYRLTEKGVALAPVITELAIWSDGHLREFHKEMNTNKEIRSLKRNKKDVILNMQNDYQKKNWL